MKITTNYHPDCTSVKVHPVQYKGRNVRNALTINDWARGEKRLQYDGKTIMVWDSVCCVMTVYPDCVSCNGAVRAVKGFMYDWCYKSDEETSELLKIAEDNLDNYGCDCPMYIQF